MPEKLLVSNQILVTFETAAIRNQTISTLDLEEDAFRFEPTVFVPRLTDVVKNIDIESILLSCSSTSNFTNASIPLLCVHTEEGMKDNTEELLEELKARHREYSLCHQEEHGQEEHGQEEHQGLESHDENEKLLSEELQEKSTRSRTGWFEEGEIMQFAVQPRRPRYINTSQTNEIEDDVDDDEEDHHIQEERERRRFNEDEVLMLEEWFFRNPYPTEEEKTELSDILRVREYIFFLLLNICILLLQVPSKTIRIWFQNKRVKCPVSGGKRGRRGGRQRQVSRREANSSNSEAEEEEETFQCNLCDQSFSTKWNMKVHMQRFHQNQGLSARDLKCMQCGQQFGNNLALKLHIKKMHYKKGRSEKQENRAPYGGLLSKEHKVKLAEELDDIESPSSEEVLRLSRDLRITVKQIMGWLRKRNGQRERRRREIGLSQEQGRGGRVAGSEESSRRAAISRNHAIFRNYDEDDELAEDEEDYEDKVPYKVPYNPGHKKTKFSEFQRNHLRDFFQVFIS